MKSIKDILDSQETNQWLDDVLNNQYKSVPKGHGSIGAPKKRNHPEREFQIALMKEFRKLYPQFHGLYFMIKQESHSRGAGIWAKRMGLRAGVADTFLAIPRRGWNGIFFEIKWDAPWTEEQQQFKADIMKQKYLYVLIRKDKEKFIQTLNWYLG